MKIKKQLKNKKKRHSLIVFSQIGLQMSIIIASGVFIGYKLDEIFQSEARIFTIIISLLFIFLSIYYVIKQVSKYSESDRKNLD